MSLNPDLYDRAADDVSRDGGWLQGALGTPEESDAAVCAMGALYRQCDAHLSNAAVAGSYFEHLRETLGLPESSAIDDFRDPIAVWNDHPDRTAGEVADAFRTAAKGLRD